MTPRLMAAVGRRLRRRVSNARRRAGKAWRSVAAPLRRRRRYAGRALERMSGRAASARRSAAKRASRLLDRSLDHVTKAVRHTRLRAWRYTLHYPLRWGKKYGWWAWKRVHRWVLNSVHHVIYKAFEWQGATVLLMTRMFAAVAPGLRVPGAWRWHGALIFVRLVRLPMPRLPRMSNVFKQPRLYKEARGIHLKERGRSYEDSFQGPWGQLRYRQALEVGKQKKALMWEAYTRVSRPVMLNVPYVYVALHFQPERTTSSLGGPYADQYLLIDMIARCIPAGWKVYVKEHPSQFYPGFCGERSRHAEFYADLLQLPHVELVSLSTSSFLLIDHARAVATVTGTVGWEAIVRGVPALVFGSPWYRACDGVWLVPTEKTLREALAWIEAGMRPDYHKVRLFVRALELVCARAGLGYGTPDEAELGLSRDEAVERLSAVLHGYWNHMQEMPPPTPPLASLDGVAMRRTVDVKA